jgi:selenocysteine lyase/cysteine desulfurase
VIADTAPMLDGPGPARRAIAHTGRVSLPLGSQRDLFEVPDELVYLNTANMSPLLRSVRIAGEQALARRAAPWSIAASDWFDDVERLRTALAGVMGVVSDGVALVPASSYGLAVAARNLTAVPGQQVVVLAEEYPSNYYTWRRFCARTGAELAVVERMPDQTWTEAVLDRIGDGTAVLAVPNVHWTNGSLLDLAAVVPAARRAGAAVVIDASQSLGAMPLDVAHLQPDFLVSIGYKGLLGPQGIGCLYVAERYRDGEPIEENWANRAGSEDFAALVDYTDEYRAGARRFDVGQRTSFGLVPMAVAAAEQILDWTVAGIAASLRAVTDEIGERVAGLGFSVPEQHLHGPHMFGIELPRDSARALGERLRAGGVIASVRGTSLRIAPHLHTTESDIDRFLDCLAATA